MQYPKFKVNVQCATFQHAKYITDAMNGFTMQQTDFPFVCTIIDDASTDGEQDVISNYLDTHFDLSEDGVAYKKETDYAHIIYAQHKTNKNCYFAVLFLKENHYSQKKDKKPYLKEWRENVDYIALCEGDDYWTDPHKLQKQVDIMESDKDVMMVYTGFETVNKEGQVIYRFDYDYNMKQSMSGFVLPFFLYRNVAMTVSCMFRKEVFLCNYKKGCNSSLDYLSFLCAAALGKVAYINEKTCCYRKVSSSLTNSNKTGIQKEVIRVLDYMTTLYEKGEIPMSKIQHLKTKLYIVAKGIDLYIKGFGIIYFKTHSLRANILLFIFPGLLLETYHLLKYYYNKIESSHE